MTSNGTRSSDAPDGLAAAQAIHDNGQAAEAPACTLVIFGAGGDLTKRLLMPALYNLSGSKLLPDVFKCIGVDRTALDDEGWRQSLTATMQDFTKR